MWVNKLLIDWLIDRLIDRGGYKEAESIYWCIGPSRDLVYSYFQFTILHNQIMILKKNFSLIPLQIKSSSVLGNTLCWWFEVGSKLTLFLLKKIFSNKDLAKSLPFYSQREWSKLTSVNPPVNYFMLYKSNIVLYQIVRSYFFEMFYILFDPIWS